MSVVYKLVGYSRRTEYQLVRYDIPEKYVPLAKTIAGIDPNDPTIIGEWPLKPAQAKHIGELMGKTINVRDVEFFLAPYERNTQHAPPRVHA